MTRTVIAFQPAGQSIFVSLERSPILFKPDSMEVNLAKITGATMMARGQAILELLSMRDPVKATLQSAFDQPVTAAPSPLYFHIRAMAADIVEWEQIYTDEHGFCALDPRWPVGRIASTVVPVRAQTFAPPLRIVALLAAAGRDARPQLDALLDAIHGASAPTQLHVISGDDRLVAAATAAGQSGELMKGDAPAVCRQVAAAQPHLLHILGHGGIVANAPTLAFATTADVDEGRDDYGSVRVFIPDLVRALLASSNPWLVVLNACETADASQQVPGGTVAHDMVSAGLTAVIGMRRKVELRDADRFCAAVYPELLAIIETALTSAQADPGRAEAVIDWAAALTAPRRVMGGEDPSCVDVWSDPVLYAQSDDLRVVPVTPGLEPTRYARLQGERDSIVSYLRSIDAATANSDVVTDLQHLLAGIDTELSSLLPANNG